MGAENFAPTDIRFPDRPARSESLYRLSCRGQQMTGMPTGKLAGSGGAVLVGEMYWCLVTLQYGEGYGRITLRCILGNSREDGTYAVGTS